MEKLKGRAQLEKVLAVLGNMHGVQYNLRSDGGTPGVANTEMFLVEIPAYTEDARYPFGMGFVASYVMRRVLEGAVKSAAVMQSKPFALTVVVGTDNDKDVYTFLYRGELDEDVAIQRAAQDMYKQFSEDEDDRELYETIDDLRRDFSWHVESGTL